MQRRIRVGYLKPATAEYKSADNFYVLESAKYPQWVYKIVLGVLNKLGFKALGNPDYLPAGEVNEDDLYQYINTNRSIVEDVFKRKAKHLLLGRDAIQKLGLRLNMGAFDIEESGFRDSTGVTRYNQLGGMTVHLIPWMIGSLVIPDLDKKDMVATVPVVNTVRNVESI